MKRYNLRRMVAYGRIPGYTEFAGKMTAEEYVQKGDGDGEMPTRRSRRTSARRLHRAPHPARLSVGRLQPQLLDAAGDAQPELPAGEAQDRGRAAAARRAADSRLRRPVVHAPDPLLGRV
jgi:hypothetical protein